MKPPTILSAIRLGESALREKHGALNVLWRKFGRSIRASRRKRGISLTSFAASLGVTPALVSMMESGVRSWGMERAEKAVKLISL